VHQKKKKLGFRSPNMFASPCSNLVSGLWRCHLREIAKVATQSEFAVEKCGKIKKKWKEHIFFGSPF
jgi:hypothetical protein